MLIMVVVLLLFGGKKLPELARGLGKGIREFKDASEGVKREIHRNINSVTNEEEEKKEDAPKAEEKKAEEKKPEPTALSFPEWVVNQKIAACGSYCISTPPL